MKHRTGLLLGCVGWAASGLLLAATLAGCDNNVLPSSESSTADTNGSSEPEGEEPPVGDPSPSAETAVLEIEVEIEGQGAVEQQAIDTYIELTATPEEGWQFDEWSGTLRSSSNPVTILATESTQISALFVPVEDPPPPPPRDTDGDGVFDDDDGCPETPAEESADADGCSPSQLDTDGDQVSDADDLCSKTPPEEAELVDERGCAPSQLDTDLDGVMDDVDQCADTPNGAGVLPSGCALGQLDIDLDGVFDDVDQCPSSDPGEAVDSTGCRACGNFVINAGELCDPPNGTDCDADCQIIVLNDSCVDATAVSDGSTFYSNIGTSTDGPQETTGCETLKADVWFCYTATCSDVATVNLCDSDYDTMMTVYEGCGCPGPGAIACDDDLCEGEFSGAGSQVDFPVVAGESYMIRVGGWDGREGTGTVAISCGQSGPICGNGETENGEQCDDGNLQDGDGCDSNCTLTGCGNGITTPGEECDDGSQSAVCDADCTAALCGDDTVNSTAGEQCEPPDTATCDATCQIIAGSGATTWTSTQYMFGVGYFGLYTAPESYELDSGGTLTTAHVAPDVATMELFYEGNVTVLSTGIPLGAQTDIYRIEFQGDTLTESASIDAFSLSINGTSATWVFDYTVIYIFVFEGFPFTVSIRLNGQHAGTVSGDGMTIDWNSVTGTATGCDDFGGGCNDFPLEGLISLGSWTTDG